MVTGGQSIVIFWRTYGQVYLWKMRLMYVSLIYRVQETEAIRASEHTGASCILDMIGRTSSCFNHARVSLKP